MPLDDARRFVDRMKEDNGFREKVLTTTGPEGLASLLRSEGMRFDERELVGAMAECMAQMEQQPDH
jgi:predicted ribosomally synthesized peptide with nif11-like leader